MSDLLFTPLELGGLKLANRFVMSPMTRARTPDGIPSAAMAEYYAQRAQAGLIIGEATRVSPQATGYVATPGIYDEAQVAGWRRVTEAVHDAGSTMVCQLWHVGRVSHRIFQAGGAAPVAPSAIRAPTQVFGPEGMLDTSEPLALTVEEIDAVIGDFRSAAENAKKAGFDGVELHGANGYLIHQFLSADANRRSDDYGGSIANRCRFLFAVVDAVAEVWPAARVGVRIGPQIPVPGIADNDSWELYEAVVLGLRARGIGFLHIGELIGDHPMLPPGSGAEERWAPRLKALFGGPVIINGGLTAETAEAALGDYADLTAFGIPFLANPDLPERVRLGAPLNEPNPSTFYGGGTSGYTDYPTLEETLGAELSQVSAKFFTSLPPERRETMGGIMRRVLASKIEEGALGVGDRCSEFELSDAEGQPVSLAGLLNSGPLVLSFYRGGWCPYCNLELRALHRLLPELRRAGAQLVAVTPELPDVAAKTALKQEIDFPVLSDQGQEVARSWGLVYTLDPELRGMYDEFGIDLAASNGDSSGELPIPATYVIDRQGIIGFAFASADHTRRAEPHEVLRAVQALE